MANFSPEDLGRIVTRALTQAKLVYDKLGKSGLEEVQKNQHGETALRADVQCEQAVLDTLRTEGLPVRVISEEHGTVEIGDPQGLRYTAVLDGLDGSNLYRLARGFGRYGTMLAIYDGLNPCYKDYLVCAVMELAAGRLYLATRGRGAWAVHAEARQPMVTSRAGKLQFGVHLCIDEILSVTREFEGRLGRPLAGFQPVTLLSTSVHYVDLACGLVDAVLEFTRKGNLELAIGYGLVTEANGVVVDEHGKEIGDRRFHEFGQATSVLTVAACTMELARDILAQIQSRK